MRWPKAFDDVLIWFDDRPPARAAARGVLFFTGSLCLALSALSLLSFAVQYHPFYQGFMLARQVQEAYASAYCEIAGACYDLNPLEPSPFIAWTGRKLWAYNLIGGILLVGFAHFLGKRPSPVPDRIKKEEPRNMERQQMAGLFLLMTGTFCLLGGGYFFYDHYAAHNEESFGYGLKMALIAAPMLLIGALLKMRMFERVEHKPQPRNPQSAEIVTPAKEGSGFKVFTIVFWVLMPIIWPAIIWLVFSGAFLGASPLGESFDIPFFTADGMAMDADSREDFRDMQDEENAIPIGGE